MGRSATAGSKLLPEDVRRHNRTLVLQTLLDAGPRSRADLARETGITRVTMSDLVGDLLGEGLLRELGLRTGPGPGKPSMQVDIDRRSSLIVGIDVSDHVVFRGALLSLDGEILVRATRSAEGANGVEALRRVVELAADLVDSSPRPVLGIGVATPGIVDDRGLVLSAPNLGWTGVDLSSSVRAATGVPCHVANDADLAALAERSIGESAADIVLVRIGRGVGAGILLDGRIRHGSASSAGEIGHVIAGADDGPLCICGKRGCLETWLAAPRLTAAIAAAGAGSAEAVLSSAGERLGLVLSPVIAALDPDEIVVNGPPELVSDSLVEATNRTIHARTTDAFHGHVAVRRSTLGLDATLLGAAARVLEVELGLT